MAKTLVSCFFDSRCSISSSNSSRSLIFNKLFVHGRRSVLLWRHLDMLHTASFMDSDSIECSRTCHRGVYSHWPTEGQHWAAGEVCCLRLHCSMHRQSLLTLLLLIRHLTASCPGQSKDRSLLFRAFTTYVRPLLEYSSPIWFPRYNLILETENDVAGHVLTGSSGTIHWLKGTNCYSSGSDRPRCRRRTDRFIVFARWRQCAPLSNTVHWAKTILPPIWHPDWFVRFCRAHQLVCPLHKTQDTQTTERATSVTTDRNACDAV